jgi:hypothetical protein
MDMAIQHALLKLRQRFTNEDSFGGNDFQDGMDTLLPAHSSSDWTTRTAHGNALLTAYKDIVKDVKLGKWPEVRTSYSARRHALTYARIMPGNALDSLDVGSRRAAIRLQRKIDGSGVAPAEGDIGPVRPAKSIFARRIEPWSGSTWVLGFWYAPGINRNRHQLEKGTAHTARGRPRRHPHHLAPFASV